MECKPPSKLVVAGLVALLFPILSQASQTTKTTKATEDPNIYQVSEKLTPIALAPEAVNRIHSSEPIQKINAPKPLSWKWSTRETMLLSPSARKPNRG